MTGQRSFLFDYVERFEGYVKTADKTLRPMVGYGKITDGKYIIKDVRYVEGLGFNMFSSSQFCDNGYWVKQFQYGSNVNDEDNNVILSARRNGNLYSTVFRSIPQTHPQFAAISDPRNAICLLAKASKEDSWLWHRRLCHQNFKDMNKLVSKNLVKGLPETRLSNDTLCPACEQGKMTRSSHPPRMDTSSKSPLDMIHMDLCGPTRTESLARKKYMLVLVDEFSRFTWVEFLRAKSDAADRIIAFIKRIQVLLGRRVKKLRSDNGTEFRNAKLQSFLEDVGISHNFSAVRTPQQNGVVERKNRTLVEAARSMMAHSGVPQSFWAEAVSTACYTQNRTLIVKRTGKTAYEMVEQRKPNIDYFRVFGCKCYVLNDRDDLGKFEPSQMSLSSLDTHITLRLIGFSTNGPEPSWKAQMLIFQKPKLILWLVQVIVHLFLADSRTHKWYQSSIFGRFGQFKRLFLGCLQDSGIGLFKQFICFNFPNRDSPHFPNLITSFPNRIFVSRVGKPVSRIRLFETPYQPKIFNSFSKSGFIQSRVEVCCFPNRTYLNPESDLEHFRIGLIISRVRLYQIPNRDLYTLCVGIYPHREDKMSKEMISIGSETRPPVLVVGEYQQWKRRMTNFLNLLDDKLMISIREGPIRPTVTVAEVARIDISPHLPAYEVEKPYDMYSPEQRTRAAIDKRALTLLTMALLNGMFVRVDSCKDARSMWLGIEQQMQGGDKALEGQKENAMNAYEGFCAREGESLTDTYNRLNTCVSELRRLGLKKNRYEVNVKFLRRLSKLWQSVTISIQVGQNLGQLELQDLFSMMLPHEETLFGKTEKKIDPPALALMSNRGPSFH
ncbi:hypothetical protein OSB04_019458 [Centaurea solstitialis]|uniref:Integrase catalytic domain-containing protein n=1 Tax=Centaurea solstitialis TaxID=347529 RepID=A0AA38SQD8_9ASTR|nr:hypothetical protein OSB04_019458 [Centaurea solstitialis]